MKESLKQTNKLNLLKTKVEYAQNNALSPHVPSLVFCSKSFYGLRNLTLHGVLSYFTFPSCEFL